MGRFVIFEDSRNNKIEIKFRTRKIIHFVDTCDLDIKDHDGARTIKWKDECIAVLDDGKISAMYALQKGKLVYFENPELKARVESEVYCTI